MNEPETEKIIELITKQTQILLHNHWADITDYRDGEESIKVGFGSLIQYQGQERIIETTISFGKRVKDSTVERINTVQLNLPLATKEPEQAAAPTGKKRGRGRPPGKKNILQTTLGKGPQPEPPEAA